MMPLNLFKCENRCAGAEEGPSRAEEGLWRAEEVISHPLSPLTLPSTVCEAGANEGACVRKKFRRVRVELSRTELFS